MSNREYFSILTEVGKRKMNNAVVSGTKVNITKIAVGDGGGIYYEPNESMQVLKNEVWRGNINSYTISEKDDKRIIVSAIIPVDVGGFTIREAGIFDNVGNMIAICNTPDTQKATIDENVMNEMVVSLEIVSVNRNTISIEVDPNIVTAKKSDLDSLEDILQIHEKDTEKHIEQEERVKWDKVTDKVDKADGMGLSANDFSDDEKNKLAKIEEKANYYQHPNCHPADMIVEDRDHKFVTELQVDDWNGILQLSEDYANLIYQQSTEYVDKEIASHTHAKSNVGLGNVDNTADADKNVKYAETAGSATDATKAPISHASAETTHGVADNSKYGHVKLSNGTNTVAGGTALAYNYYASIEVALNDYRSEGEFTFYNITIATDFPDGTWTGSSYSSHLSVKRIYYNTIVMQILIKRGSFNIYVRYSTSATVWSAWKQIAFLDSEVALATKAAQDASGNTITNTYASGLSISGKALTLTSKDSTTLSTVTIPVVPKNLYNLGYGYSDATGGWKQSTLSNEQYGSGAVTLNTADIYLNTGSTYWSYCTAVTTNLVDLSNYSLLFVEATVTITTGGYLAICTKASVSTTDNTASLTVSTTTARKVYALSIGSISSGVIKFQANSNGVSNAVVQVNIHKVWLE